MAGAPFTVVISSVAASAATVGAVTVHAEQVPADIVTDETIARVPAGSGLTAVTVNGLLIVEPAPTFTVRVQVVPAADPDGTTNPRWSLRSSCLPEPPRSVLSNRARGRVGHRDGVAHGVPRTDR